MKRRHALLVGLLLAGIGALVVLVASATPARGANGFVLTSPSLQSTYFSARYLRQAITGLSFSFPDGTEADDSSTGAINLDFADTINGGTVHDVGSASIQVHLEYQAPYKFTGTYEYTFEITRYHPGDPNAFERDTFEGSGSVSGGGKTATITLTLQGPQSEEIFIPDSGGWKSTGSGSAVDQLVVRFTMDPPPAPPEEDSTTTETTVEEETTETTAEVNTTTETSGEPTSNTTEVTAVGGPADTSGGESTDLTGGTGEVIGSGESTETSLETGGTGEGGEETEGGGVPGPGSWTDWLTGVAIAGIITAGLGLLGTLGSSSSGAAPTVAQPPPPPPPPPPSPHVPPADAPRLEPAGEYRAAPPSPSFGDILSQGWNTAKEVTGFAGQEALAHLVPSGPGDLYAEPTSDAPEINKQFDQNVKQDLLDITHAVMDLGQKLWGGLINPDNWIKAADVLDKFGNYLDHSAENPMDFAHDAMVGIEKVGGFIVEKGGELAKEFLDDPTAPLRAIASDFDKAMDPNTPVLERLEHSTIATLNVVGILEGAGALKNVVEEGIGKLFTSEADDLAKGLAGKVDDTAKAVAGAEKTAAGAETTAAGAEVTGAEKAAADQIPVTQAKEPYFDNITPEKEASLKDSWAKNVDAAQGKLGDLERGLSAADAQTRIDAALQIQKDPLAVDALNRSGNTELIERFNKEMADLHDAARRATEKELAEKYRVGLDRVSFKAVTGDSDVIKAGMDKDLTFRIDGLDVDSREVQEIYDRHFYEAAGKPAGIDATQFGKDLRNQAVDVHSAEAIGTKTDEVDGILKKGSGPVDAETVARTTEFKATERFAKANELAAKGDLDDALKERFLGIREMGKEYTRQVEKRVAFLNEAYKNDPNLQAWIQNRVVSVKDNIEEVNRMVAAGADPVQVEQFLQSRHTSSEELAKQISDVYEVLGKIPDPT